MAKAGRRVVTRTGKRSAVQEEYKKFIGRKVFFMLLLSGLAILIVGVGVTIGPLDITIIEVYAAIIQRLLSIDLGLETLTEVVVWNIRLPRLMWGVVAGFTLGVAGCAMQIVLRNPLASPFTLGIAAGANFGLSIAILLNLAVFGGMYAMIGNSFIFALLCCGIILGLSSLKGGTVEIMILAGIALNYVFSSASQLFRYYATYAEQRELTYWGTGDLGSYSWDELSVVFIAFVVCLFLLMRKAWDLNVMSAGDDTAKSLGVNSGHLRLYVMVVASFLVASLTCFVGTIAFIGLVGPHIARMVIGGDNRFQIPASGLVGAVILIGADILGMNIASPAIVPTGIMSSIVGVPFFFYLILKRRREYW
jgi:iron complex transport system permease protein